jgi:putative ABC transport system permease protein
METVKFTLRIVRKRPLRSLLTVLQVALGVWIVAIILSLNFQASGRIDDAKRTYGGSLAKIVVAQYEEIAGYRFMMSSASNLRYGDLARVQESDLIENAFIYRDLWEQQVTVRGLAYLVKAAAETTSEYADAIGLELVEGQFFTKADEQQRSRVVLISEVVAEQLFPNQSALGQILDLGDFGEGSWEFEIIGVYKLYPPLLDLFITQPHLIFPLDATRTWMSLGDSEPLYHSLYIQTKPDRVYEAVADVQILLADRATDDLEVQGEYFEDSTSYLSDQVQDITLILGAFAFIAVLVSAIGILSIMLVSVVERTREIGLRQALGATKGVIIWQILNESLVFSCVGSALGLGAALLSANTMLTLIMAQATYVKFGSVGGLHPLAAALAVLVTILMGQLFGLYPAWQAAKMTPVEALKLG